MVYICIYGGLVTYYEGGLGGRCAFMPLIFLKF